MKSTLLAGLCLLAACQPGCGSAPADPVSTVPSPAAARSASAAAVAAPGVADDYPYAQHAAYEDAMRTQLSTISKDLDQLEARTANATAAVKAEAQPRIQALREQVARLNAHLDQTKDAPESTWTEVKATFRKGYSELDEGIRNVRQWMSDQIAP